MYKYIHKNIFIYQTIRLLKWKFWVWRTVHWRSSRTSSSTIFNRKERRGKSAMRFVALTAKRQDISFCYMRQVACLLKKKSMWYYKVASAEYFRGFPELMQTLFKNTSLDCMLYLSHCAAILSSLPLFLGNFPGLGWAQGWKIPGWTSSKQSESAACPHSTQGNSAEMRGRETSTNLPTLKVTKDLKCTCDRRNCIIWHPSTKNCAKGWRKRRKCCEKLRGCSTRLKRFVVNGLWLKKTWWFSSSVVERCFAVAAH